MTEDIIRMAREAGLRSAVILHLYGGKEGALCDSEIEELAQIERFFHMAQAAERERIIAANALEIERVNAHIKALEDAVKAEREACLNCYSPDDTAQDWADKIRARGEA